MSRPRLSEAEKKEKRLTVRFKMDEMEEFTAQADVCGLNISELARRRSLHRRVVPATDLKMTSEPRETYNARPMLIKK
jgi:ActR/RegA family two-component response regulator